MKEVLRHIPTEFRGTTYRSKLESEWAATFDTYRIPVKYEPVGRWYGSQFYLVDFEVAGTGQLIEVKGKMNEADHNKLTRVYAHLLANKYPCHFDKIDWNEPLDQEMTAKTDQWKEFLWAVDTSSKVRPPLIIAGPTGEFYAFDPDQCGQGRPCALVRCPCGLSFTANFSDEYAVCARCSYLDHVCMGAIRRELSPLPNFGMEAFEASQNNPKMNAFISPEGFARDFPHFRAKYEADKAAGLIQ